MSSFRHLEILKVRSNIVFCTRQNKFGDNEGINVDLSPVKIREGLLRTGKFDARKFNPEWRGKYHLTHPSTNTLILIRYEGDSEDRERESWRDPEPQEGWISLHPDQAHPESKGLGYCKTYRLLLPDILEFGRSEKCYLRSDLPLPGRAAGDKLLNVEFRPS